MNRCLKMSLLGAVVSCTGMGSAQAQAIYGDGIHGGGVASTYGYAGPAIRGEYVGAPLTRFPRPDQLVPSAWGYGTYGVPTVSGIAPASIGAPTVYVIEAPAQAPRGTTAGSRVQAAVRAPVHARPRPNSFARAPVAAPAFAPDGPRIISVRVPPRQASLR